MSRMGENFPLLSLNLRKSDMQSGKIISQPQLGCFILPQRQIFSPGSLNVQSVKCDLLIDGIELYLNDFVSPASDHAYGNNGRDDIGPGKLRTTSAASHRN